jgi:hypothetical protein
LQVQSTKVVPRHLVQNVQINVPYSLFLIV